jgi:hypothetical protein
VAVDTAHSDMPSTLRTIARRVTPGPCFPTLAVRIYEDQRLVAP